MKKKMKNKGLKVEVIKPYSKTDLKAYASRMADTVKQYRPDPAAFATSSVELGDYWR